jgi:hypothetical protein
VALSGITSASQTNVLTYDTASGQIYYTASSAIGGGGLAVSNFTSSILEYYVDKRFTGSCNVTINSTKIITSTNANYLTQLSASRVGNPTYPWPDPWSAAFAASASIAAGQTTSARVIVKTGNQYTYGSSTLAQNGDTTGSLINNLTPDIAVSQVDYNSGVFNLLYPSVEVHFEPETSLYNINKTWTQELTYYTSSDWTLAPEFKITGKGKFVLVYGFGEGFICKYATIAAPRAEISIEADLMLQNLWTGWYLNGQKIDISVNRWLSYTSRLLELNIATSTVPTTNVYWNWPSQSLVYPLAGITEPVVNVNINTVIYGEQLFEGLSPHINTVQAGIVTGHPYGCNYNISIDNIISKTNHQGFFRPTISTNVGEIVGTRDNNCNIDVRYVSASTGVSTSLLRQGGCLIGIDSALTTDNRDRNSLIVNIEKMDSFGVSLGPSYYHTGNQSNCFTKIHCDNYTNYSRIIPQEGMMTEPIFLYHAVYINSGSSPAEATGSYSNNVLVLSGNYTSYSTGSLVRFASADGSQSDKSHDTLILDNFNGFLKNEVRSGLGAINLANWSPFWPNHLYSTGSVVVVKNSLLKVSGSTPLFRFGNAGLADKTPTVIVNNLLTNRVLSSSSGSFNFEGNVNVSTNINNIIY